MLSLPLVRSLYTLGDPLSRHLQDFVQLDVVIYGSHIPLGLAGLMLGLGSNRKSLGNSAAAVLCLWEKDGWDFMGSDGGVR